MPIYPVRAPPVSYAALQADKPNKSKMEETIMYANFMKHNFKNYFAPDGKGKGGYKEVKRGECFAYDSESFSGKYPQRWYWDVENDFAIRLERNENGRKIYNEARAERRRATKEYLAMFGCVRKECLACKGWDEAVGNETKCDCCVNHITFIALDEERADDENAECHNIESDTDIVRQSETNALLDTLHKFLLTLDANEQKLWQFLVNDAKKKVIAAYFGWTLDQLSYRQLKLYTKLRSNSALKNFFEKS